MASSSSENLNSREEKVSQLRDDNYGFWNFRMKKMLQRNGVWEAVSGQTPNPITTEWTKYSDKAFDLIVRIVHDSQLYLIENQDTAKDAWNMLKKHHHGKSLSSKVRVMSSCFKASYINGGWVVDSGATCHMCAEERMFSSLDRTVTGGVTVASGHVIPAVGRGIVNLFVKKGRLSEKVTLSNVLFVPELDGNLISVKNLIDNGFVVDFRNNGVYLWRQQELPSGEMTVISCWNLNKKRFSKLLTILTSNVVSMIGIVVWLIEISKTFRA